MPAQRGEHSIGAFSFDDSNAKFDRHRFDVKGIGNARIGHDRGGIAVYEDDFVSLFFEALAGWGASIIELRGLTNDDWPGADYKDFH